MNDNATSVPRGAWLNREIEVTADRLAHGGAAVGRVDGRVVFVRGALPGERVRAVVVDDRKAAFCHADVVQVVTASPHRVEAACPAAAAGAGCCDLSYVTLDHARKLKAQVLADTLTRLGRLPDVEVPVAALPGDADGWRVRARLAVDGQGYPGFHAYRGAQIVTERCAALDPAMYTTLHGQRFQPGSEVVLVRDGRGEVHVVEIAQQPDDGRAPTGGRASAQRRRARAHQRVTHLVAGSSTASFQVGSRQWEIPTTGFWQAHRAAPEVYSATVVDLVRSYLSSPDAVVWDLYGGAGVFTAALLDADGLSVTQAHVVDTDAAALAAAEHALAVSRVSVHRGAAEAVVGGLPTPDVVVLDPPRSGAGRNVVAAVTDADPRVVVHVGCDAAAFARDLGLFADHGYRVARVGGFDAFPRTHHVEAIAALVPTSA